MTPLRLTGFMCAGTIVAVWAAVAVAQADDAQHGPLNECLRGYDTGDWTACRHAARAYLSGAGVRQNRDAAALALDTACAAGHEGGCADLRAFRDGQTLLPLFQPPTVPPTPPVPSAVAVAAHPNPRSRTPRELEDLCAGRGVEGGVRIGWACEALALRAACGLDGEPDIERARRLLLAEAGLGVAPLQYSSIQRLALEDLPCDLIRSPPPGMVVVIAGDTLLGSPCAEPNHNHQLEENRTATLSRHLLVDVTETTRREWERVTAAQPARARHRLAPIPSFSAASNGCGLDCPMVDVNWYEAVRFANAKSEQQGLEPCYRMRGCTGEPLADADGAFTCESVEFRGLDCGGFRLPTESEWERLARGMVQHLAWAAHDGGRQWQNANSLARYDGAHACENEDLSGRMCGEQPVGTAQVNAYGLHDMLGNVVEWAHDWIDSPHPGHATDPVGSSGSGFAAVRGGAWNFQPAHLRPAVRFRVDASERHNNAGFRLVRTINR